jgi:hypothetical protein
LEQGWETRCKNWRSYQPGPEKEIPLSFHQETECSTHQPVEGEKEEAVGDTKVNAQAQTGNSNSLIDETTQTDQQHSHDQVLHKPPTVTQRRERSTQITTTITGRQLTPTKYLNTEESQKPWRKCTSVRSSYMRGKICYKTEFKDGSVSFSESFDPDDPSLIDRHP